MHIEHNGETIEVAGLEVQSKGRLGRFIAGVAVGAGAVVGFRFIKQVRARMAEDDGETESAEAEVASGGSTAGAPEAPEAGDDEAAA